MNKEKYNLVELIVFYLLLLNGFTSFFINGLCISLIISIIIGYFLIPFLLNKQNKIFVIISVIYSFIIALFIITNTSHIIKDFLITNQNILVISLLLIIVSYFLSNKGLKSIIIVSNLLFIIYIIVIIITVLTSINNINILNVKYSITNNINPFTSLLGSSTPLFFLSIIPKHNIINFKNYNKTIKKTYIVFYIYLIIKILFITSVIGFNNNIISYSELLIFKSINIEYIKDILIINILIERFIMLSITIYYIKYSIKKRLNCRFLQYLLKKNQ